MKVMRQMYPSHSGGWRVWKRDGYPARMLYPGKASVYKTSVAFTSMSPSLVTAPLHSWRKDSIPVLEGWTHPPTQLHDPGLANHRIPLPSPNSDRFKEGHMTDDSNDNLYHNYNIRRPFSWGWTDKHKLPKTGFATTERACLQTKPHQHKQS